MDLIDGRYIQKPCTSCNRPVLVLPEFEGNPICSLGCLYPADKVVVKAAKVLEDKLDAKLIGEEKTMTESTIDDQLYVSLRFGSRQEGLVSFKAANEEEFRAGIELVRRHTDTLVELANAYNAPTPPVNTDGWNTPIQGSPRPMPPANQAPMDRPTATCPHGMMSWKSGAGWGGWFCSLGPNAPDRCKPRYEYQTNKR